ncbi:hypothetical protein BKA62DRAFT_203792 [Auriculariales sp. MPI-PUGE-AT-0066]|nr:hypothetical protein BKA62DRAFT_203792 [Auriculariales sp. MPI-PUGE-AT-0066]
MFVCGSQPRSLSSAPRSCRKNLHDGPISEYNLYDASRVQGGDKSFMSAMEMIQAWFHTLVVAISQFFNDHEDEIHKFFSNMAIWLQHFVASMRTFIAERPREFRIVGIIAVVAITLAVIVPQALMYFLQAIGFMAHGVTEASTAAAYQSARLGGAIAKGSWFAFAQSTAAGGRCMKILPWPVTFLALALLAVGVAFILVTRSS